VADDLVGGRYGLLDVIGTGGMGRVWRARDELLHRIVAVKEVTIPAGVTHAQLLDVQLGTMREARAAARLDHPGIVQVYDLIWRPPQSWIVMEYVPSRSLHDTIRDDGPVGHPEAARIGLALLSALRAAHAAGVLHRDVKPHNVLLTGNGRVVLTDFGLAVVEGAYSGPDPLLGSPHYVAPERLHGTPVGAAADLWSLGATLYAAVAGRAPFQRENTIASLLALSNDPPDPPSRPGPLDPAIAGLLIKDPDGRLTAERLEPMLRAVVHRPGPIYPPPAPPLSLPAPPRRRRRDRIGRATRFAVGAAALLLIGSVGTALAVDRGPGPDPVRATMVAPPGGGSAAAFCAPGAAPAGAALTVGNARQPYALPAGWIWYGDRSGLAVAVPRGWLRTVDGSRTCFREPDGTRLLSVDTAPAVAGAPTDHWEQPELAELADGSLPGYRLIGMRTLELRHGGADWEYTWQSGDGPRLHQRRVWLAMGPGRAYAVTWTTREADWSINDPLQQLILASLI
jgi:eukaryotic-like serine/threonine-protein kinase